MRQSGSEAQRRVAHIKLINENTEILSEGDPAVAVAFGDWPLTMRLMVCLTVGSRPVRENRVSHRKLLEDLKPSTSVAFPSKITVYRGEWTKRRELM